MESTKEKILTSVNDAINAVTQLTKKNSIDFIEKAAEMIAITFRKGNKILIAGNGGSLCDAAHVAEEFCGIFRKERPALPAIALTEPGFLSCVANDMGYEKVFARAIEALGKKDDLFIGLTTSGNSANLVHAFAAAEQKGMFTMAFLGRGGGKLRGVADVELLVEQFVTSDRIQETHMAALHIIVEMVEEHLFYAKKELQDAVTSC